MNYSTIPTDDLNEIAKALKKYAAKLEGKTILITGGTGFLGNYIVASLLHMNNTILKTPCKLIVVDNFITSSKVSAKQAKVKNVTYLEHNVINPLTTVKGKIDYIIHAAGIASPIYYKKFPLEAIDVAIAGTRNMLELAKKKKVKSFLFFSSSEIYGNPPPAEVPTKETYNGNVSCIGPRSCYDESKRLGETISMTYFWLYKTPIKIVRPFNVYGPGMRANDFRVLPRFILSALQGKVIPVHSNGTQTRAFCYISDATIGFLSVLLGGKDGEVYNVGNDKTEVSMNTLSEVVNEVFDNKLNIKNVSYPKDYPQDEPQRRCPDLTKVKETLKFIPSVDLKEGVLRTITWCRKNWNWREN